MRGLAILLIVALAGGNAFAARSTNTDDAPTIGKGTFVVEIGTDYTKMDEAGNKAVDISIQPYYGVLDIWDVSFALPITYVLPASADAEKEFGIANIAFWNKVNILNEEAGSPIGLSAVVEIALPTGDPDKGIGSDKTDIHAHGVISKTLVGGLLSIHGNIGYTYPELPRADSYPAGEEPEGSLEYAAALDVGVNEMVSLFGEVYGGYVSEAEDQPVNVNTGAGFNLGLIEFDCHADFGLTDATTKYSFGGGVAFGF